MKAVGKRIERWAQWISARSLISVLCVGLLLTFVGCDLDDEDAAEPDDVAYVSLYQASPDAPDLGIVVDDRQINAYPFDYADYTGYLRFYTGERNLKFRPFGASNVVIDSTVTFEDGVAYSVFVIDEYPEVSLMILEDDAEAPTDGNALIRFLHLSPDAPEVDLTVDGQTDDLFSAKSFKEESEFIEIAADNYDFEVRTTDGDVVTLNIPDITLQAGWYYTIVVRGYETPPSGNSHELSAQILVN